MAAVPTAAKICHLVVQQYLYGGSLSKNKLDFGRAYMPLDMPQGVGASDCVCLSKNKLDLFQRYFQKPLFCSRNRCVEKLRKL